MKRMGSIFLTLILCVGILAGCQDSRDLQEAVEGIVDQIEKEDSGGFGYNDVEYDHPESYTIGGTELTDPVERIKIDWYGGSVTVGYHEENNVSFHETSDSALGDDVTLRYRVKDGTLSLVYSKAGRLKLGSLKKDLTVLLPQGTTLEELEIDTGSAPVKVTDLTAREISVDTGSGDVELIGCQVTDKVSADTGSGNVKAELTGTLRTLSSDTGSGNIDVTAGEIAQVEADTGSGSVTVEAETLGKVEADTASGNVTITATAVDEVEVDSASGGLTLTANQAPRQMEVETVSGQITLYLPEDASFTATLDTISGKWSCELPATVSGDRYTCGSGAGRYDFSTTSGNVNIQKN